MDTKQLDPSARQRTYTSVVVGQEVLHQAQRGGSGAYAILPELVTASLFPCYGD
jgi:hypothetical protein